MIRILNHSSFGTFSHRKWESKWVCLVRFLVNCKRYNWLYFILIIAGMHASIYLPPVNEAVQSGGTVVLNCMTNAIIYGWTFQAVGSSTSIPISVGCSGITTSVCSNSFASAGGTTQCNLTITNASSSCAGEYVCTDTNGTTTNLRSAMVIVLDEWIEMNDRGSTVTVSLRTLQNQ